MVDSVVPGAVAKERARLVRLAACTNLFSSGTDYTKFTHYSKQRSRFHELKGN